MQKYDVTVDNSGTICFYKPGTAVYHRLDGPAVEYSNGEKAWYQDGKRHRLDGPAVEYSNGGKFWYIEDKEYTEEEFKAKVSPAKASAK